MLTYQQKRIFLIVVMVAMLAPMILLGLGRHIRQRIYVKNCPAIRGVGEFERVFNEYAAEKGLSMDLSEAAWKPYGKHYYSKTVPVHGTEEVQCSVIAWDRSNGSEVRAVKFYHAAKTKTSQENASLEACLRICFRIFAPSMYASPYAGESESGLDYMGIVSLAKKKWLETEEDHYESFYSDHISEWETLQIQSRITEDGTYEKGFTWS